MLSQSLGKANCFSGHSEKGWFTFKPTLDKETVKTQTRQNARANPCVCICYK